MKVSVASGKGGTGKTTMVTNLALSLGKVQVLDCDVEEPNSNIFLKAPLKWAEDVALRVPVIDKEKCDYCGKCSQFCQYNALAVVPGTVLVFSELCHGCGGCTLVCPKDAITETPRVIGKIEKGEIGDIRFERGLLNVGEAMAIPVLKALKRHQAEDMDVLMDAPPGTSCPVIETLNGSDYCIFLTEPTPFGLHDLKLAVDVARTLKIPFGVVINRDGVGNDGVAKYCQAENIPIILRIPNSREIARLYSDGIPFVSRMPEWKDKFLEMWENIRTAVEKAKEKNHGEDGQKKGDSQ